MRDHRRRLHCVEYDDTRSEPSTAMSFSFGLALSFPMTWITLRLSAFKSRMINAGESDI